MTNIDQLLKQGIDAARTGRRDNARALLMRVIEADERNELAWLWLSSVVNEESDRRICLENVLEINPNNPQAQRGIAVLNERSRQSASPDPASTPTTHADAPNPPATGATIALEPEKPQAETAKQPAEVAADSDDYACPYCGAQTSPKLSHCPACRRSLMIRGQPPEKRSTALTILAILWGIGSLFALLATVGVLLLTLPLIQMTMEFGAAFPFGLLTPLIIAIIYTGVNIAITVGLLRRRRWAYIINVILLVLNVIGILLALIFGAAVMALLVGGMASADLPADASILTLFSGGVGFLIGLAPIILIAVLTYLSYGDFYGPKLRITTTIGDQDAEGHYNIGVACKNRGMWYMAAREWATAVHMSPNDADYRRALGLAYAQLKRFDDSLQELRSAQDLAPNDARIHEDITVIERLAIGKTR